MKEKWKRLRKSSIFNLALGFLWLFVARMAFHFLPLLPALLLSSGLIVLILLPLPRKKELEEDFRQELAESKKTWKSWNR